MNQFKRISTMLLAVLLMTSCLFAFAGGDGTAFNPFQITTFTELSSVRDYLGATNAGKYFKVMNNIDASATSTTTWVPIGNGSVYFYGNFDGNNCTIFYLRCANYGNYHGLFGIIAVESTVRNVVMSSSCYILGDYDTGSIVGNNKGIVKNCQSAATVNIGNAQIGGGVVGNNLGRITNCEFTGTITRSGSGVSCSKIGGVVGSNDASAVVDSSFSSGSVSGNLWNGGVVGWNDGTVNQCYSSGSVNGAENTQGGLVGQNNGTITNSYSRASVTGANAIGGLVGYMGSGSVTDCYATGLVTGGQKGGLCGASSGTVNNSYWDKQTTGLTTSYGSADTFGKTSAEMQTQSTFTGWDFTAIWHISADNNGYPHLGWQLFPPLAPIANSATNITNAGFTASWSTVSGATGYYLDVSTDSTFTNFVSGYHNNNVYLVNNFTVTGLTKSTPYYYRVTAYNSDGAGNNSNTIAVITHGDFSYIGYILPGVHMGSVAWGDYDNDGDLDILLTGSGSFGYTSKVYSNNGDDTFTDINASLPAVYYSSADWGDYDNDGDLDILLTGYIGSGNCTSKVYRNDNGTFTDINAGLVNVYSGSVAWGDYDNDGDLDILLTGQVGSNSYISKIYRNNGNDSFTDINAGLVDVGWSSVVWGDYDNDGDLDILITGRIISKVYRNNGNDSFTDINAGLTGVESSSVAWGDYDNDGDLDILLAGATGVYPNYNPISKIYRNNGNSSFTDINAGLTGVLRGSVAWGDYDNDGDLDILLTGNVSTDNDISKVYRNNGNGTFTDINAVLPGVYWSSVAWGDYDNDGDLDILLTGDGTSAYISQIYRNNSAIVNAVPTAPTNLSAQTTASGITFSWSKSTDSKTPQNGLGYNIAIGSNTNLNVLKTGHSNLTNGWRKVAALGNTNKVNSYKLNTNLPQAIYRWSVQAIDHSFAGSFFTDGNPVTNRNLVLQNDPELTQYGSIIWEAVSISSISSYQIQIASNASFSTMVIDVNRANNFPHDAYLSLVLKTLNGYQNLQNNQTYYWRIKPIYSNGLESGFTTVPNSFIFKTQSPNSPTNGLPNGTSVAVTTTTLNWTAPSSGVTPTSYSVYLYSAEDCFTTPIINGASVTATSYSGLILKYNTNYRAKVFANYNPLFKGTSPALDWDFKTESKPGYTVKGKIAFDGSYLNNYFIAGTFNETNQEYSLTVSHGDSVVLAPKCLGYAFTPASTTLRNVTVNQTNINFTAADTLAPTIKANAQAVTNSSGQVINAQSTESTGFVYVVKASENPTDVSSIETLILANKAAKTAVTKAYDNNYISTAGLLAGTYYAYAADKWNNLSVKGANPIIVDAALSVAADLLPTETKLYSNYPNPFNPMTEIKFDLKNSGDVILTVFSIKGEVVKTLVNEMQNAGRYSVNFDATGLNSGVYFYKLEADGKSIVKRMLMVK